MLLAKSEWLSGFSELDWSGIRELAQRNGARENDVAESFASIVRFAPNLTSATLIDLLTAMIPNISTYNFEKLMKEQLARLSLFSAEQWTQLTANIKQKRVRDQKYLSIIMQCYKKTTGNKAEDLQ